MIIADPNSSLIWIKYMTHHLMNADVDAARAIAKRALSTIGFREEDEKYNIWIALLNLEYKYGGKDSFEETFKRANAESKGKYIHINMAETCEHAGDTASAEKIFERALKIRHYKKSKKIWIAYQQFRLRNNNEKGARELLSRSMQSLSKHKHIEVIIKFALGEFDNGSADRGRVLFEDLLSTYPKRTDIWHVYLDREIKMDNHHQARQLFERMTTLKTSMKNIKTIFKKYMEFEVTHGTAESVQEVKEKAQSYVASLN